MANAPRSSIAFFDTKRDAPIGVGIGTRYNQFPISSSAFVYKWQCRGKEFYCSGQELVHLFAANSILIKYNVFHPIRFILKHIFFHSLKQKLGFLWAFIIQLVTTQPSLLFDIIGQVLLSISQHPYMPAARDRLSNTWNKKRILFPCFGSWYSIRPSKR